MVWVPEVVGILSQRGLDELVGVVMLFLGGQQQSEQM